MKRILLVGGTFNNEGGRESGLIRQMTDALQIQGHSVDAYNGGFANDLSDSLLPSVANYDIVMWMPNVPNDIPKMRDVKAINPKAILVSSKRNDNAKYSFAELINRALALKSNLTIEFAKQDNGVFNMRVFDPLGGIYYNGTNIESMVAATCERADLLTQFTRIPSMHIEGDTPIVPNEERFFEFARGCSDIFHNLIQPDKGVTRFLGNMSFRCQNGFPSFRGEDGMIYVSRRNVDKREIKAESFVPTSLDKESGAVKYYGEHKPSVDTPIQQRLYELFPQMNYMLHAHCYIDMPDTISTNEPIPCGAVEEVDSVYNTITGNNKNNSNLITVNLMGHGCIIMAASMDDIDRIPYSAFIERPVPEDMTHTIKSTLEYEECR